MYYYFGEESEIMRCTIMTIFFACIGAAVGFILGAIVVSFLAATALDVQGSILPWFTAAGTISFGAWAISDEVRNSPER